MSGASVTRVLFVCLGNICRSPTAEGVFSALVKRKGLQQSIIVDSCGTGDWHVGSAPDPRAIAAAAERGYNISPLRGRQVDVNDFDSFDYILAMDEANLADLQALHPGKYSGHLGLFLEFAPDTTRTEVPDPYYDSDHGFEDVLDLIESASDGLLERIVGEHSAS